MNLIKIVIISFIILESTNILALYFFPDSKLANSIGIFKAWKKSKDDQHIHDFVKYLINWIAGTKLIFIMLLIVILINANDQLLLMTAGALSVSIASFFWRLFPLIRSMDKKDQIEPKDYSKLLGWMILLFVLIFATAIFLE